MAVPAGFRPRCRAIACCALVAALSRPVAAQPAAPGDGPAVVPAGAQAGTAAEAVPEVPTPPAFHRPESVAGLPPAAEPAVSLKKAAGRLSMLAGRGNDLGMDMADGEATFAVRDLPGLTFGPSAGVVFVDGPVRTDLPPRLYTGQFDVRWFGQLATPLFYEVAFMPAVFTDGDNTGSDALRLQGRGVGYLAFSEQTQVALGATYLDREDVPLLPIFGVLHAPSDDLKLELVFPRPRVLGRVSRNGDAETWAYAAGELGGGSWAIERQNGREDVASYRDYRLLVGLEQKRLEQWSAAVEAGYVFGRELEYESGRGDYSPDNTFLLRMALSH
ncbi:MAG TPA: hypothetical protein VF170_18840 [Planctomycetaceae bacterium]